MALLLLKVTIINYIMVLRKPNPTSTWTMSTTILNQGCIIIKPYQIITMVKCHRCMISIILQLQIIVELMFISNKWVLPNIVNTKLVARDWWWAMVNKKTYNQIIHQLPPVTKIKLTIITSEHQVAILALIWITWMKLRKRINRDFVICLQITYKYRRTMICYKDQESVLAWITTSKLLVQEC